MRHLEALKRLGLTEEHRVHAENLPIRKLYALRGLRVNDFSYGGLKVVSVGRPRTGQTQGKTTTATLETMAKDLLVRRREIRQRVKRLARAIEEFSEEEAEVVERVEAMDLSQEDRLVLETVFTEETVEEAEELLTRSHQVRNSRQLIEGAMSRARRNDKK